MPGVQKRPQADCGLGAQNVYTSRGTTLIQLRRRSPHGLKQDLTGHGVIRRRLLMLSPARFREEFSKGFPPARTARRLS